MIGLDLFPRPTAGAARCDLCGKFVAWRDAVITHEFGDYGTILSTEAFCPSCAETPAGITLNQETGRDHSAG